MEGAPCLRCVVSFFSIFLAHPHCPIQFDWYGTDPPNLRKTVVSLFYLVLTLLSSLFPMTTVLLFYCFIFNQILGLDLDLGLGF